jgi:hypothetical protein
VTPGTDTGLSDRHRSHRALRRPRRTWSATRLRHRGGPPGPEHVLVESPRGAPSAQQRSAAYGQPRPPRRTCPPTTAHPPPAGRAPRTAATPHRDRRPPLASPRRATRPDPPRPPRRRRRARPHRPRHPRPRPPNRQPCPQPRLPPQRHHARTTPHRRTVLRTIHHRHTTTAAGMALSTHTASRNHPTAMRNPGTTAQRRHRPQKDRRPLSPNGPQYCLLPVTGPPVAGSSHAKADHQRSHAPCGSGSPRPNTVPHCIPAGQQLPQHFTAPRCDAPSGPCARPTPSHPHTATRRPWPASPRAPGSPCRPSTATRADG